jgi:hypothetical protein
MSKVNVVFDENAEAVQKWAETSATALGQSRQQALEAAGTFGNLFQAFGISRDAATDMSTSLVELAADLASFNNTSVDDALLALRSGLSGETEPLRRFGVSLSDVRLKETALRLGLIKTTKTALTPAIKAQAAYALILQDTKLAQGDFARTSSGLANQQRILRAQLQDTAATIGTALLPTVTKLVGQFSTFLTEHQGDIQNFAAQLPAIADQLMEVVGNLPWDSIGNAFSLMGTGARALLDAFVAMPPWVQTAILTAWGTNKLTGGALTGIVSALASGLIRGVLGINAGVVNINAATVNGGLGGGTGDKGGGKFPFLPFLSALGVAFGIGELTGGGQGIVPDVQAIKLSNLLKQGTPVREATAGITVAGIKALLADPSLQTGISKSVLDQLREIAAQGREPARSNPQEVANRRRDAEQSRRLLENLRSVADRRGMEQAQATRRLQDILNAKKFDPKITVNTTTHVNSSVSITDITRRLTSQRIASGVRGGITFD